MLFGITKKYEQLYTQQLHTHLKPTASEYVIHDFISHIMEYNVSTDYHKAIKITFRIVSSAHFASHVSPFISYLH